MTQLAPDRLGLPPPLDLDLVDAGRRAGWITADAVGFRGFADETEAAHAAWIAHRTLARKLARTHGVRPVPVDIEPLAIQRIDGKDMILASGRPVAELIRPGAESRSGADSFGIEIALPTPISELEARASAYLIYRTLRKSGVRWALWRPEAPKVAAAPVARTSAAVVTTGQAVPSLTSVGPAALPVAGAAVLALGVAAFIPAPLAAVLVAGIGATGLMLLRRRRLG
jgi:hypothetical protein